MREKYIVYIGVRCTAKSIEAAEEMGELLVHEFAMKIAPDAPAFFDRAVVDAPVAEKKRSVRRRRGNSN